MTKRSRNGLITRAIEQFEEQADKEGPVSGSKTDLPAVTFGRPLIGGILEQIGKLRQEDIARVLKLQEDGLEPFGQIAIKHNLVVEADVQQALSIQSGYSLAYPVDHYFSRELRAAYDPFSQHVDAIRSLRTELLGRWIDNHNKIVAIVSPERHEGRSYLAANLAVIFAHVGCRTLLIDADFRFPTQHHIFKTQNRSGLSSLLGGRFTPENIATEVPVFRSLRVLVSGPAAPNPVDLLASTMFAVALTKLKQRFDVILVDTPCNLYPEALSIASRADRIVMVMRKHRTRMTAANEMKARWSGISGKLIGCVLSDF